MEILLNQGKVCLIDAEDMPLIEGFSINYDGRYVTLHKGGKKRYLHRVITGIKTSGHESVVDHINRNKLDNRRENLRIVSPSENMVNQTRPSGKTGYRGVTFNPWAYSKCGKFRYEREKPYSAEIKRLGKRHYLGRFKTAEEAHAAFLAKAEELLMTSPASQSR